MKDCLGIFMKVAISFVLFDLAVLKAISYIYYNSSCILL